VENTYLFPPEEKRVVMSYRVPYADTDQMSVVYYANYFVFFERLRNELIRKSGKTYLEIEQSGLMFPVVEATCHYVRSAQYDDELKITGWLAWVQGSRFQIEYEILRGTEQLVTGHTIHNVITMDGGRPRRVPDCFSALVTQ